MARLLLAIAVTGSLGTGLPGAARGGNGGRALRILPKDTAVIVSINVDRARQTATFRDLLALARKNPQLAAQLDQLKAKANFDVVRDVKTIVLGMSSNFQSNREAVLLFEGDFHRKKLLELAVASASAAAPKNHRGMVYYELPGEADVAFLDPTLMAITGRGGIVGVIDVHRNKKPSVRQNRAMMTMLRGADRDKDVWSAVLFSEAMKGEIKKQTGGHTLEGARATLDLHQGIKSRVRLAASTDTAATALAAFLRIGLDKVTKEPTLQAMGLEPAMRKLRITRSAAAIDLDIDFTPAELDKLKTMVPGVTANFGR